MIVFLLQLNNYFISYFIRLCSNNASLLMDVAKLVSLFQFSCFTLCFLYGFQGILQLHPNNDKHNYLSSLGEATRDRSSTRSAVARCRRGVDRFEYQPDTVS